MTRLDEIRKEINENHHPFCSHLFRNNTTGWSCKCDLLKEYDKWRNAPDGNVVAN